MLCLHCFLCSFSLHFLKISFFGSFYFYFFPRRVVLFTSSYDSPFTLNGVHVAWVTLNLSEPGTMRATFAAKYIDIHILHASPQGREEILHL
jgi:hypothetical protein